LFLDKSNYRFIKETSSYERIEEKG